MTRLLACIDASTYANSVCALTAWAAKRLDGSVEILHVIQRKDSAAARNDLSGAIGLGVKSELLEELTRIDEAAGKIAIERGRALLSAAEESLREAGVTEIHQVHRHGGIIDTIVEQEATADLVVIGKRGASSAFASEHIGSNLERVVRGSNKPVLIASRHVQTPKSVVLAYDGSPAARRALHYVAGSRLFEGLGAYIVVAGPNTQKSFGFLEEAAVTLSGRQPTTVTHLADGPADTVIAEYLATVEDPMLVMGAYGHSPFRAFIVGSTTTTMIRTVRAPVLLLR
ncbi:Universal stress protein [Methyloligella halotolerans]|uniref:Universal stress protein n=1 Tax=Methyloligella halotolerans TaxID=1177755 RepID=A0A1E2RWN4_9HYPH|nr:universal stress protein [Methyloligella halotolerans]ODA66479.1 Universal stress protein [Methyloligella halotolerans]